MLNSQEYKEGKSAFIKGKWVDCPYENGTNEENDWEEGYSDAEYEHIGG
jgi:hypothetical protein